MERSQAIRLIKERVGIADLASRYVHLRPNGSRLVAPCPFHQETRPSFSVNPDKGMFYCFGCHASGDIFEFYGRIHGLEFREALEQLADECGIVLDDSRAARHEPGPRADRPALLKINEAAAAFYMAALESDVGADCRAYIDRRGIDAQIRQAFRIGWAPQEWRALTSELQRRGFSLEAAHTAGLLGKSEAGHYYDRFRGRMMFPIRSLSGQIVAFGGRIIQDSDEAKYINTSDTPVYGKKDHLYGLDRARQQVTSTGSLLLTEGYMDVVTLHQFGFANSAGVLGTALTPEQIQRISGFTSRVTLVFDGDRAGRQAALRSCEMLLSRGLTCQVVSLPEGEDIDSLLRASGPAAFETLIANAADGLGFCVDTLQSLAPREAVEWSRRFLGNIQVPELASPLASQLALKLKLDEQVLRQGMTAHGLGDKPAGSSGRLLNVRDSQILIFAVRYPHRLSDLRMLGADLALTSDEARRFWGALEKWGPEEAFYHLDERQKSFWQTHCGPNAPPCTSGDEELAWLEQELSRFYTASQRAALHAALAHRQGPPDFESDLEYLRALQETLENKNE